MLEMIREYAHEKLKESLEGTCDQTFPMPPIAW